MREFLRFLFYRVPGEENEKVSAELCASTFGSLRCISVISFIFEVVFLVITYFNRERYGEYFLSYCIMYILMIVAAVICLASTQYIKGNVRRRYRLFYSISIGMSLFLTLWAIVYTYFETIINGRLDPALYITIAVSIPLCFFLKPAVFIIVDIFSFAGLMWILSRSPGNANILQYLSYVIFYIIQFFIGFAYVTGKRAETEGRLIMEEQKKRMEELLDSQNRFFSSMSHEIRTPVNVIIVLNEMTLKDDISDEVRENSENIEAASRSLLHTVNEILDMSRLESGSVKIVEADYKVASMCQTPA